MSEASWVRSVYLYAMCAVSIALVVVGLSSTAVGLVHAVVPDLGHRDTLDRVGIGLSNIGSEVVDLFNESQVGSARAYCEDIYDDSDDVADCVEEEQSFAEDSFGSIEDGIAEVKDELTSQIRNSSIDRVIRGLLMTLAGVLLFRIHGGRTELFADGLRPKRRAPEPVAAPPPVE